MNDDDEYYYELGKQQAARIMLGTIIKMSSLSDIGDLARLIRERAETIQVLRRLCKDYGDNDWTDDLSLADIIDKHLGNYIDQSKD